MPWYYDPKENVMVEAESRQGRPHLIEQFEREGCSIEPFRPVCLSTPAMTLEQLKEQAIRTALARTVGQVTAAARLLDVSEKTLHNYINKLGLRDKMMVKGSSNNVYSISRRKKVS